MSGVTKNAIVTSPWLIAYADPLTAEGLLVENLLHKRRYSVSSPAFLTALRLCGKPQGVDSLVNALASVSEISTEDAQDIVQALIDMGLLTDCNAQDEFKMRAEVWNAYGWADALEYHAAIYDYPFLDYSSPEIRNDVDRMKSYSETDSPPPIYKTFGDAPRHHLEKDLAALHQVDLRDLLTGKSEATGSTGPISQAQLSTLLYYTFGETGKLAFLHQGAFLVKTSPSGGARHPVEAYVILFDTELAPGLYHYAVCDNSLELLRNDVSLELARRPIFELRTMPSFPVKALIVLTAIVSRSMWRYREPRSYRVILHDLGHIRETMRLVCEAVGLKSYFGHGFHDSELESYLGITGCDEPVFTFAALG